MESVPVAIGFECDTKLASLMKGTSHTTHSGSGGLYCMVLKRDRFKNLRTLAKQCHEEIKKNPLYFIGTEIYP